MGRTREEYFEHLCDFVMDCIRQEREVRGMCQADLADKAWVTEKWISRLETRGDNLSLKSHASFSWALEIDAGNLLPSFDSENDTPDIPDIQHTSQFLTEVPPLLVGLPKAAWEWWEPLAIQTRIEV